MMPAIFRLAGDTSSTPTPVDTSTNAPSILAINGFFCAFTVIVVLARIYVRAIMLKTFGTDDYLITAATICGVGVLICFIGETQHGVGMHTASITAGEFVKMLHWQFFHSLTVTLGISLIKLSVAFFLLRLVPGKAYKWFLHGVIIFLVAFTLSSEGTILFSCVPIRASWDRAGEPNAKCFDNHLFTAIGMFNSIINIITDVLFASLPISVVWSLQVNLRTKLSLLAILSLGYFACAASIVKTVIQAHVLANPDSTRSDSYFVWNSIELYIGILAASLPSLRPLFRSILENTRSLVTRRTGMNSSGQRGTARHKYYVQDEGIGMHSLPTGDKSGNYDVRITTKSQMGSGAQSEEDFAASKGDDDGDSLENILPLQGGRGITKTVNVSVT
ncbi:phosphatidylserine decarboxylase [Hyaloscypha sp. PMI_1271]|nr:phosphatidylserine decarboxylase [Hyaloscypha sp. PMI_1271]